MYVTDVKARQVGWPPEPWPRAVQAVESFDGVRETPFFDDHGQLAGYGASAVHGRGRSRDFTNVE